MPPSFPLYFSKNIFFEKLSEIFARNSGMYFVIHLYGDAFTITFTNAEAADQSDGIGDVCFIDCFLQKCNDFRGALQMAGAAHTNLYNNHILHLVTNVFVEEFFYSVRRNGEKLLVCHYTYTLLAFA